MSEVAEGDTSASVEQHMVSEATAAVDQSEATAAVDQSEATATVDQSADASKGSPEKSQKEQESPSDVTAQAPATSDTAMVVDDVSEDVGVHSKAPVSSAEEPSTVSVALCKVAE